MVIFACLAVGLCQSPTDSYGRFVERLSHAQTLSGIATSTVTQAGKSVPEEYRFWFKRNYFSRVEHRVAGKLDMVWVVDGKDLWRWHPIERRLDWQANYKFYAVAFSLFEAFQSSPEAVWIETGGPPAPAVAAGQRLVRFELKPKSPPDQALIRVDMDPKTDLPVQYGFHHKGSEPQEIMGYKDLKFDPVIDPAKFRMVPEVKPNSWSVFDYMLKPSAKAPDFSGQLLGGHERFRLLKALKENKATLVEFMEMGCAPCWERLRTDVEGLRERYASKGLNVLVVGLGSEKDVSGWVSNYHVQMPVVIGDTCSVDLFDRYKIAVSQTEYLIDSKGVVRARYDGAKIEDIEHDLAKLGIGI